MRRTHFLDINARHYPLDAPPGELRYAHANTHTA